MCRLRQISLFHLFKLQGVVYLGLSVWGITNKHCSERNLDLSSEPFKFALDLIYFLGKFSWKIKLKLKLKTQSASLKY